MKTRTTYGMYSIISYILCGYFVWSAYSTVQTMDSFLFQIAIALGALAVGFIYTARAFGVSLRDTSDADATEKVLDTHHNDYIHSEIEASVA